MSVRVMVASTDAGAVQALAACFAGQDFVVTFVDDERALAVELEGGGVDCVVLDGALRGIDNAVAVVRGHRGALGLCGFHAVEDRPLPQGVDRQLQWPPDLEARLLIAELALKATGATSARVAVRPSTGLTAVQATPLAPTPGVKVPTAEVPTEIEGVGSVARTLLELSRMRTTAVVTLRQREAEARVGFVDGVVVGASDNAHDNRLDARLLRSGKVTEQDLIALNEARRVHGQRVGEACLALGLLTAAQLLEELRLQSVDRLVLAIGWSEGRMALSHGRVELDAIQTTRLDAQEAILRWFLRRPDPQVINAWLKRFATRTLHATVDVDRTLAVHAQLTKPPPLVPLLVRTANAPLHAVLRPVAQNPEERAKVISHMHALWHAGAFVFDGEVAPQAPLPPLAASARPAAAAADQAMVEALEREWVRVRGKTHYAVLGLAPDASPPQIQERLHAMEAAFGSSAMAGKKLGEAQVLADAMQKLIDEMRATLLGEAARRGYGEALHQATATQATPIDAEVALVQAKLALQGGDVARAMHLLEQANTLSSASELLAWWGWARFLDAAEHVGEAVALIKRAHHQNPSAARPLVFLGLIAEQQADIGNAQRFLQSAARLLPDDVEVQEALKRLGVMLS